MRPDIVTGAVLPDFEMTVDMSLEAVAIPVSDVDRAKAFYASLGWRLDADEDTRRVQFTPPGSSCSIVFGASITPAQPGSAQGLHLVVFDIDAARDDLVARSVEVSDLDGSGSFAFRDPDGNGWVVQEITTPLPQDGDDEPYQRVGPFAFNRFWWTFLWIAVVVLAISPIPWWWIW